MLQWDYSIQNEETQNGYYPVKFALVVEDNPAIRDILDAILSASGYRPLLYSTAEDALEEMHKVLKSFVVSVLIVDVMLPGMTGIEFIKELERRQRRNAPVVAISAHRREMIDAQGVVVDAFFQKPFHLDELVEKIDALVEEYKAKQRVLESL